MKAKGKNDEAIKRAQEAIDKLNALLDMAGFVADVAGYVAGFLNPTTTVATMMTLIRKGEVAKANIYTEHYIRELKKGTDKEIAHNIAFDIAYGGDP